MLRQNDQTESTVNLSPKFVDDIIKELDLSMKQQKIPFDTIPLMFAAFEAQKSNPDKKFQPFEESCIFHDREHFESYNGNFIKAANMAVCEGPQTSSLDYFKYFSADSSHYYLKLEKFISEVLLHPQINHVIALGDNLEIVKEGRTDSKDIKVKIPLDFFYYFDDKEGGYQVGKYKIKSCLLSGIPLTRHEDHAQTTTDNFATYALTITNLEEDREKTVTASFCSIKDGTSIEINEANQNFFLDLYQHYLNSLENGTFITTHCSAGKGRSPHIVAMFMFTRLMNDICENKTAKEAADKIIDILKKIREDRTVALPCPNQFKKSFLNAVKLYQLRAQLQLKVTETEIEVAEQSLPSYADSDTVILFKGAKRMRSETEKSAEKGVEKELAANPPKKMK